MHIIQNAFRNVCMRAQIFEAKFICYRPPKTWLSISFANFLLEMVTLLSIAYSTLHIVSPSGTDMTSARSKFRFDIEVKPIPTPCSPTKSKLPTPVPGFYQSTLEYPNPLQMP